MKIWIYWSESNSWIYFYIVLNENCKIYWSEQSFPGLGPEDWCSSWGLVDQWTYNQHIWVYSTSLFQIISEKWNLWVWFIDKKTTVLPFKFEICSFFFFLWIKLPIKVTKYAYYFLYDYIIRIFWHSKSTKTINSVYLLWFISCGINIKDKCHMLCY